MEKLSSGYRINRAADDAAGLAISEKMRGQIGGLAQAQRNAQDGISLVQTAEGALTEVHSMLQRVRDLKVQFDNGTLDARRQGRDRGRGRASSPPRSSDIATKTKFNGIALLDASGDVSASRSAPTTARRSTSTDDRPDRRRQRRRQRRSSAIADDAADAASSAVRRLDDIDDAIKNVSTAACELRRGAEPPRAPPEQPGDLPGEPDRVRARIRDVDMAAEMTNFTKLNILQQAGTSMLAQANQAPQGVLSLLR